MIYFICLYESGSGNSLFEISFQNEGQFLYQEREKFLFYLGAFFSAINKFITTLVFYTSKKIKLIELDNYFIKFVTIAFHKIYDLIIISDKTDLKYLDDLISELKEIIYLNPELFYNWKGIQKSVFNDLESLIRRKTIDMMTKNRVKIY